MKKNCIHRIVKKSIIAAMSVMLISASPAMNIAAAKDTQVVTFDEVAAQTDEGAQESKGYTPPVLTEEESDLVNDIHDGLLEIGNKQETLPVEEYDAYDVIDDAHNVVNTEVDEAIDKEVDDANKAAQDSENAAEAAKELDSNIKAYEEITDELLNKDQEIVESVEGNTDGIVETITKDGDILLNVEGENGEQTQVKVEDYTKEKADIAVGAADDAKDSLNNILTSSDADIEEERAKIDEAIATAEAAKEEAETAYSAAQSVLIDEIKRYNAYAAKYGLALYEYTDENGSKSTPAYTEEELANLADLTMNKDEIGAGLDNLNNNDLSAQLNEIKSAETLVSDCGKVVDEARGAIDQIKDAEEKLISGLENMMAETEEALKTATGIDKEIYQAMYDSAKALLDEYRKPLDQTHPNPDMIDNYENRFDYSMDSASSLADEVEQMVNNANNELYGTENSEGAVTRYQNAYAEYEAIKAEYNNYLANKDSINANFADIEKKLANAKAAVNAAHEDLVIAIDAVNTANKIKEDFENIVADMNKDSGSSSGSGDSSNASNTAPVIIEDTLTPLTDTVTDEQAPLTENIMDEQVPLADSVPKTGDASAAAGAVGATGIVTMLGALLLNLKKRTLR